MRSKIEYALFWKEIRQSAIMVIVLILLMIGNTVYLQYLYLSENYSVINLKQLSQSLFIVGIILSFGLGFLQAAGVRILEAAHNLEAFLFSRPVERFTLIKVYYVTSVIGWLIFAVIAFLCYYYFSVTNNIGMLNESYTQDFYDFLYFQLVTFIAHGVTFFAAILFPSLAVCATAYVVSAIISGMVIYNPDFFWQMLNQFEPYFVNVLLIGIIIAGAFYLYKNKQLA